ncbi:MAG TPA: glycosyltransferase, partial [Candidatus Dormibacteraeota bacterium]
ELDEFVRGVLGREPREGPRVLVIDRELATDELAQLYRAANAFVLASRGEGYGRPYLEAMAMGLPTIGTRWGGNVDFMNDDNSYLVDCEVVDIPEAGVLENPDVRGHKWAEPDVRDLRRVMRSVFEDRELAKRKAQEGRRAALENHSLKAVAAAVVARLAEGGARPLKRRLRDALPVTWEGPHRIAFGIAEVNREIGAALRKSGVVDLLQSETADSQPWLHGRPPEVTVRHQWPPDFIPPDTGRWITYQPWEYGSLPAAWVEPMNRLVDEVWVPTTYVRDCYVRSGVDAGKVAVVPYGIDPDRFHPEVAPLQLPTQKKHRFLFVGGTIARKGVDILLDAYVAAFQASDDVCLVIKDVGSSTFYHGQGMGERIRRLQADPAIPEILYIDDEIPASDMPGLFTACQYLVHPYRGEGFGLPIAEAMACGLAVVVPRHGACLDFCDDSVAYMVDAMEVLWPQAQIGTTPTIDRPWWGEVAAADLASAMRHVVSNAGEARQRGAAASARIRSEWTWAHAASVASDRLQALAARPNRLSACVIVKNEERSLPRCLKSLRGLADEVIVVDTGSIDKTADVARRLGAKVISFPWSNDFAAARNEAIRHATGNWVLIIDADEWLDSAGRTEIRWILNTEGSSPRLLRQVTRGVGEADGAEVLRARLFPNRLDIAFAGTVGEALVDASGNRVKADPSGVVVHHEGVRSHRRKRLRRILSLLEQAADEHPEDAGVSLDLGRAYLEIGLADRAEEAAQNALDALIGRPAMMRQFGAEPHVLRARALLSLGRSAEAVDEARIGARINPTLAEAHATLAVALAKQGALEAAAAAYRAAIRCHPIAAFRPVDREAAGRRSKVALQAIERRLSAAVGRR